MRCIAVLLAVLIGLSGIAGEGLASTDSPGMQTLRAGFIEFPPFKFADAEGHASGPWVEMTEAVAQEAGYKLEWIQLPIARIYRYLRNGKIDLWPGTAGVPELQGAVLESETSPMHLRLIAFHRAGLPSLEGLDQLPGARIIRIAGFTYLGALDVIDLSASRVTYAPDHRSALAMLKLGRGDYLLDYDEPVAALLPDFPGLRLQGQEIHRVRGAFIVSRRNPQARDIISRMDAAYRKLIQSGQLTPLQDSRSSFRPSGTASGD